MINKKRLVSLPSDLRELLLTVIEEESSVARKLTEKQQLDQIAAAKADGVTFLELAPQDRKKNDCGL
ncbi:MAG: hypothetical protein ACWGOX_00695 [Desulforhopalus sp.]